MIEIAVDVEGGDGRRGRIPHIEGAINAVSHHRDIRVTLVGNEREIADIRYDLGHHYNYPHSQIEIVPAESGIPMTASARDALRATNSSMAIAAEMVSLSKADALISCGNTIALTAFARKRIDTLTGVEKPALLFLCPTASGTKFFTDGGANPSLSPEELAEVALMGLLYAKTVQGYQEAKIGFFAIGTEDQKAPPEVVIAMDYLIARGIKSILVEPDAFMDDSSCDITVGVADGHLGNLILKAYEGAVQRSGQVIKEYLIGDWLGKVLSLPISRRLRRLKTRLYPPNLAHAYYWGIAKPVIKIHGGCEDWRVFEGAILSASNIIRHNLFKDISPQLMELKRTTSLIPA